MNKFNGGRRQLLESLIHNKKNFVVQQEKLRTNSRLVHSITNVKSTIDNRLHASSSIHQKIRSRLRMRIQSEQRQIVATENRRFLSKMTEIMNRRNNYLNAHEEKKRDLQAVLLYQESADLLHYPGISDREQDSV
jgi:hemoglobin-like flavoprotein